ncbi:MAG: TonB-dependent receptor [Verrucomicrobiaceae bacterium]|nr:TonB-dependent receptor [Verrucomicrobiaceae bacterium]
MNDTKLIPVTLTLSLIITALTFSSRLASAQEQPAKSAPEASQSLDAMVVIGSSEKVFDLPGTGYFLDANDLKQHSYLNVNRMLTKVPGVYLREEDGFGNFPNISIRGGDGTRSENVTIMEDGILTAPAAYSAPSAYYSPNAARMSGIEILKGSSQVRFGPHTTGGVVNYLSTPFSDGREGFLRSTYGSNGNMLSHLHYGDVSESDSGRMGILAELFHKGSDGFRRIDSGNGYNGSSDTGFKLTEPMIKLFWEPNSDIYKRLEFKYGYSRLDADETYAGLTEHDLNQNPYRRYAGTYLDNIFTEHHRTYLKYFVEPSDNLNLQFAGYYNSFARDWYKIRKTGGQSIHKVLANPGAYANAFDNLRLRGAGTLGIRSNNRSYDSYGAQANASYTLAAGNITHDLKMGARLHHDSIRRFQRDDTIVIGANGKSPSVVRGLPGSGGNRLQESDALSLWIEDEIDLGKLKLIPGLRYESVDLSYTEYRKDPTNTATESASGNTNYTAPGIGMTYELSESELLFGSIYRGISSPGPRSYLKKGVDWEESTGYELGMRHQNNNMAVEIAGFLSDFDNLTGSNAGLGGSDSTNAGAAEVYGLEFLATFDPLAGNAVSTPMFVSATWTDATLENGLSAGGGDGILAGGIAGAHIPYIPEWKLAFGAGLAAEHWGIDLAATYVSDSFGTAANLDSPGSSSRQGKIDGGVIFDLAANIQLSDTVKLIGGVHNVFDEILTVSRIPEGPRNNAPREFYVGFEIQW